MCQGEGPQNRPRPRALCHSKSGRHSNIMVTIIVIIIMVIITTDEEKNAVKHLQKSERLHATRSN